MSDVAHSAHRMRGIESRLLYAGCYLLFLARAVIKRAAPWRRRPMFGEAVRRESVLSEAATAASVIVGSAFMGL
jgi:hypothetical protein